MDSDTSPETNCKSSPSVVCNEEHQALAFASFGGAVLDEIRIVNQVVAVDSLGGAGTHATLGARLFLPGDTVAWQLLAGEDFPVEVESRLRQWGIRLSVRRLRGLLSTRNVVNYHDHSLGAKTFRYLRPIISLAPSTTDGNDILAAKAFHFHVRPDVLKGQVDDLHRLRKIEKFGPSPFIIWEPTRPSCISTNLEACIELAKLVDVFSPNHDELAALHGESFPTFQAGNLEKLAQTFVDAGIGLDGNGTIVVRAGQHGSLLLSRTLDPIWLPPFYEPDGTSINPKVVDTTGAGNSFLGGFAAGFLESGDIVTAGQYGSVTSSYMLEQIGLPQVTYSDESG